MTATVLTFLAILSIISMGLGTSLTNPKHSKFLIGLALTLIAPDLYYSGGLHGAIQAIAMGVLFFVGALGFSKWEKALKYFLPIFTIYLLLDMQEAPGFLLVIAGITTPLATVTKTNKNIKRLLFISALCWGVYAFYHEAWFAFTFEFMGLLGIIFSLFKESRLAKTL